MAGGDGDVGYPDEPRRGRHLVFGIVALALVLASIDQTIVATALGSIQTELHAQLNWSTWTITIYALGQVVVMPLAGRLSDMYGRKTVFLSAAALFSVASLACGLADDIYVLVALRALQAVGGGAFIPSATGIVSEQFGRDRDRAVGMFTSIFPIGGIVGPTLGGVFVTYASWRWIFFVNLPIGLTLVALGLRFIPASRGRQGSRIDGVGIALFGSCILAAMFGISFLGSGGVTARDPGFLLPELAAFAALVLFVRHARADPAPFIPLLFLSGRGFAAMNFINLLFGGVVIGLGALVPIYAEDRFGISSLDAGTVLSARAVGMIVVAGLAVLVLRRTGHRTPMFIGFTIVAIGMALICLTPGHVSHYAWLATAAGITGIGMGMSLPASNNATLHLARDEIAAVAGLRGMFRQSGAILAVAISTAVAARSPDAGLVLGHVFLVFSALLLVVVLPVVLVIPEHRGSW